MKHYYCVSFFGSIDVSAEDSDSAWDEAMERIENGLRPDEFDIDDVVRDRFTDEHVDPNDEAI